MFRSPVARDIDVNTARVLDVQLCTRGYDAAGMFLLQFRHIRRTVQRQPMPVHIDGDEVFHILFVNNDAALIVALRGDDQIISAARLRTNDEIFIEGVMPLTVIAALILPRITMIHAVRADFCDLPIFDDARCRASLAASRIERDFLRMQRKRSRRCRQPFCEDCLALEILLPGCRLIVVELACERIERLVDLLIRRRRSRAIRHHRNERVRRRLDNVRIACLVMRCIRAIAIGMAIVDILPTRIVVDHQLARIVLENMSRCAVRA